MNTKTKTPKEPIILAKGSQATQCRVYSFVTNTNNKNIRQDILKNPSSFVKEKLQGSKYNFGTVDIMNTGIYKEMGYKYDLRPFLKHYVYHKYNWEDIYALNKTNVRKLVGKVTNLTELN